ncbi:HlyD family type I secretion periplasmic adaptor subunit [Flavimaricola marinus]|uniref:Membrane fusion protein (MFP) family protein n=1 Tax=Flavimaricola marinus TaxID=1819565 RepID=A0A238LIS1_9RHOB|nr:HlyD family type I secretion periplasmic adaptor subunit [Flavimaricola marinus]SMY09304.1 Type I secretion system membrane fusion protein PrsE [Flavimaricola marinus]
MSSASVSTAGGPLLDLRRPGWIAALAVLALVGIFGVWAGFTVINGAVIGSGQIAVSGRTKIVQSQDGGTVEAVFVAEGDWVERGQLIARLDPTIHAINLDIARSQLAASLTLRARLQAEQQGLSEIVFSYPALPFPLPDTSAFEDSERRIFETRAALLAGGREQLAEAQLQIGNQITGVTAQIDASERQLSLLQRDVANLESLIQQGLARQSRLSELERSLAGVAGELAAQQSELARLSNSQREQELETLQSERSFLEDVATQLREVTQRSEELILEIVTRQAQLDRVNILAPAAGVVHTLQVTWPGEVLPPGGQVAEVVPTQDEIAFELQLDPRAIDQVYPGQDAQIVLSSFDPQQTPRLIAKVGLVSPNAITDERTGASHYRVTLNVTPEHLEASGIDPRTLVPGMPIEAYLQTGGRTVLAYLLNPVLSHLRHTFRE